MKHHAFGIVLGLQMACGGEQKPEPRSPEPVVQENETKKAPEQKAEGVPQDWSTVASGTEEPTEPALSPRKGQLVVTSDAKRHGDQLHFSIWVNRIRMNGVFGLPGGGTATFSIPAGAVEFSTDECSRGVEGFELAPGESMPVACELGPDGDCCEVKIPDDAPEKK